MSKRSNTDARISRPGQKTFRADPELLSALDRRAMEETVALGHEVSAGEIIRRGLEWALQQPLRGRIHTKCLVVPTAMKTHRCLVCRNEWAFEDEAPVCGKPTSGKETAK